jgi:hypothetical protein
VHVSALSRWGHQLRGAVPAGKGVKASGARLLPVEIRDTAGPSRRLRAAAVQAAVGKKVRVALVCRDDEHVSELLRRFDASLGKAFAENTIIDEVLPEILKSSAAAPSKSKVPSFKWAFATRLRNICVLVVKKNPLTPNRQRPSRIHERFSERMKLRIEVFDGAAFLGPQLARA